MNDEQSNFMLLTTEYAEFYGKLYGKKTSGDGTREYITNAETILHMKKFITSYNSKILEYGCGNGMNLRYLQRVGYKNLTGIDIAPEYIADALSKDDNIRYETSDFSEFSNTHDLKDLDFIFTRAVFQQNTFSVMMHHEKAIIKILKIFKDILKDNGKIVLTEGREWSWDSIDYWADIFKESGFTFEKNIEHIEGLYKGNRDDELGVPFLIGEKINENK